MTTPAATDRNRAIRETRADLRVALYYEDGDAGEAALAALAALGVDEAGDDLVPVGRGAAPLSGPCCGEEGL